MLCILHSESYFAHPYPKFIFTMPKFQSRYLEAYFELVIIQPSTLDSYR